MSPLPQPQDSFPDAGEARNDFWSISGNFIYRHHVEPRVKLYSPREESFPIPLKYVDVSRTTHTNLDVMQERRIDDYWNILEEKPPNGYMWSEHLWPELWRGMSKNAKLREKHKWAIEKPKLDNARRLRGIYFMDPQDKELKEIIQNARRKLETPMAPAVSCKTCKTCKKKRMERPVARLMISGLNLRVSWKSVNPQECVWKNLYRNIMRTILQEKGDNSLQHHNLVHKFIPMTRSKSSSG